jgi:hypothetical protein
VGRVAKLLALGGGVALVAACASLAGLSGGSPAGDDAGPDVASNQDAAPADPCRHAVPPPPPAKDDDPNGAVPALIVAIREISARGALDGGAANGYDLDGVCTCFGDPTTAHGGGPSCAAPDGGAPACDTDGGVDGQLGNLLAGYPDFFGGVQSNGGPTLLIKITGYNGRANDREVFVGVYGSTGIYDPTGCGGSSDAGGVPPYAPTWKGCDRWSLDEQYVLAGTTEPTSFSPGYVTDHILVMRQITRPIGFLVGNTSLPVTGATITARLVPVDAKLVDIVPTPEVGKLFRLAEGLLAGRATTTDALRGFAGSMAFNADGPLCGKPSFFTAVKTAFVCPNADITSNVGRDFASDTCDAISVGLGFAALPAQAGAVRPRSASPCGDPDDPKYKDFFDCSK